MRKALAAILSMQSYKKLRASSREFGRGRRHGPYPTHRLCRLTLGNGSKKSPFLPLYSADERRRKVGVVFEATPRLPRKGSSHARHVFRSGAPPLGSSGRQNSMASGCQERRTTM
jgi:hypothetical protein